MARKTLRLTETDHPILYEVNIRVLLGEESRQAGKRITLGKIPDRVLEGWAAMGIDAVWLMGIWPTGEIGRSLALSHEGLPEVYAAVLPGYAVADVGGSPYSVREYVVPKELGGAAGLKELRTRLAAHGIGVILDFVGNHMGRDHPWVFDHPEYFITGEEGEEVRRPDHYFRTKTARGEMTIAYGRDPTFPGWTDTAQLNPYNPAAREKMIGELQKIAGMCDGVRCDMAMLLISTVFVLTWGDQFAAGKDRAEGEFWKEAIDAVRSIHPDFLFVAEAYWNMEWQLQQLGFNLTYDKVLYDRLLREGASAVRDHLRAEMAYQSHSLRFIENHDEPRAAKAFSSEPWHYAAALIASTIPGGVLYHDGEFEGRRVKLPVQLLRRPEEKVSQRTKQFYRRLLGTIASPAFRNGEWMLLSTRPAWHDNHTWQNFLVFWWQGKRGGKLVVVNYAPHSGQCYVELPVDRIAGTSIEFKDEMGEANYVRDRAGLGSKGMYFDLQGYGFHVFNVTALKN